MNNLELLKLSLQQAGIRASDKRLSALLTALEDNGVIQRTITMSDAAERLEKTRAWVHRGATRMEIGELDTSSGRGRLLINETEFEALSNEVGRPRGYQSHESQRGKN